MKKITMLSAIAVMLVICGTGCTSFESNRGGIPLDVIMKVEVQPDVEIVQRKVVGKATTKSLFGLFTWGVENQVVGVNYNGEGAPVSLFSGLDPATSAAKNGAAYDACSKSKADLLLAPRYNLKINDYLIYKEVNCSVSGYPGKLKSIKLKK